MFDKLFSLNPFGIKLLITALALSVAAFSGLAVYAKAQTERAAVATYQVDDLIATNAGYAVAAAKMREDIAANEQLIADEQRRFAAQSQQRRHFEKLYQETLRNDPESQKWAYGRVPGDLSRQLQHHEDCARAAENCPNSAAGQLGGSVPGAALFLPVQWRADGVYLDAVRHRAAIPGTDQNLARLASTACAGKRGVMFLKKRGGHGYRLAYV